MPNNLYRISRIVTVASSLLWFPQQGHADGPFDSLRGAWSGGGTIRLTNGSEERIRCKASYSPTGLNLRMSLVCASDSYKVNLTSQLSTNGGAIKGTWAEATRQLSGELSGTATSNSIDVSATGAMFSAAINVKTSGRNQSISITAPGSEVSRVAIALKR